VQSQPSAQLSQQSFSQPQSGQPSQQPWSLQQPLVQVDVAGVDAANASTPVLRTNAVARENNDFVNMIKLTF
jgi:hypothetical protein